jgi:membrane associated rhomboid family serine protease
VAGLLAVNLLAFLWTGRFDTARAEEEEKRLVRVAEWTLAKAARREPLLAPLRARHASALAFLRDEPGWRPLVADPEERQALEDCLADHDRMVRTHPFHRAGFTPARPRLLGLLGHAFLHADFLHLFFNMLFLWAVGGTIETTRGGRWLLGIYFAAALAAVLTHALAHAGSEEPVVGSSGAVAGLMGAFAMAHGRERMRLALVAGLGLAPRISLVTLPAAVFLGVWLLEQVFFTSFAASASLGIAFEAHLGGFGAGVVAGALARRR